MGKSSPNPEQLEVAELLAGKAAGDLVVARKLAPDPEVDDDHVGFNAQQAVEKALKVALTLDGVDFPKTLTPRAAEFRYDDAPIDTLDRSRAIEAAELAVTRCQDLIAEASGGSSPAEPSARQSSDPSR